MNQPLFLFKDGTKFAYKHFCALIKEINSLLHLYTPPGYVRRPHSCRAFVSTQWAQRGKTEGIIGEYGGWAPLGSTERYQHLTVDSLISAHYDLVHTPITRPGIIYDPEERISNFYKGRRRKGRKQNQR